MTAWEFVELFSAVLLSHGCSLDMMLERFLSFY
jgi:hypothetical protein